MYIFNRGLSIPSVSLLTVLLHPAGQVERVGYLLFRLLLGGLSLFLLALVQFLVALLELLEKGQTALQTADHVIFLELVSRLVQVSLLLEGSGYGGCLGEWLRLEVVQLVDQLLFVQTRLGRRIVLYLAGRHTLFRSELLLIVFQLAEFVAPLLFLLLP